MRCDYDMVLCDLAVSGGALWYDGEMEPRGVRRCDAAR